MFRGTVKSVASTPDGAPLRLEDRREMGIFGA
jgi:hypothetical protein